MLSELKHWKTDVPSGLVVFLVAIPLCLGIALASGAPAMSGILAGIVGGLVVTIFSNSSLGVSGPAAGLVAIVEPAIQQLGMQNFLLAVVLAGVFQFVLGLCKAGTIGYYFPTAVIKGMLVAIGLIIILKQIPHSVGYDKDPEGDLAFQQVDGYNTFSEIGHAFQLITPAAAIITVVCLGILVLWETKFMKSFNFTKIVQGPLVAVVAGILLNIGFASVDSMKLDQEHLVSLPKSIQFTYAGFDPSQITSTEIQLGHGASSASHALEHRATQDVHAITQTSSDASGNTSAESEVAKPGVTPMRAALSIFVIGLTLAVVASLESLLCAEATDKLDPQRRKTDLNKELRAQGIGNFVSGLIGGLPVTQVIVRSSTNIQSGAQSRLAAFVHGVFLIVCVLAIPGVLNKIPLASLAAILFVVGYKLAHPSKFIGMYKLGWTQFLPFIITIVAILRTDLLVGIAIGLIASLFFIIRNTYFRSFWMNETAEEGRKVYKMTLAERVFFINKGTLQGALSNVEPGSKLIIDATDTVYIDQDVVDLFNDFETNAEFQGIEVVRLDFFKEAKRTEQSEDPARVRRALVT